MLSHGRGEDPVDEARAANQADELFNVIKNGGGMLSGLKDAAEVKVCDIIRSVSPAQCQAIKTIYERNHPGSKSLEATIEAKFGGALREALLWLLRSPNRRCSRGGTTAAAFQEPLEGAT